MTVEPRRFKIVVADINGGNLRFTYELPSGILADDVDREAFCRWLFSHMPDRQQRFGSPGQLLSLWLDEY